MQLETRSTYSWRDDDRVPAFDESRMLVILDGDCGLCSATARRIARLDRLDRVRLCTTQSALGRGLLEHFGFSADDPDTWLLIDAGRAYGGLDGAMRLFPSLSQAYLPMHTLRLLPRSLRNWIYARIARNRYRFFGSGDICALPDPAVRKRLVG